MADDEGLSPTQTEKLLQFQDLTGNDEIAQCREILQQHNWDIEVAVQARFAQEEGRADIYQEQRQLARTPPVDIQPVNQRIYTVARAQPRGWLQWGYFMVLFPFRFFYSTVLDILRFTYRLIRPDPRIVVIDAYGDVRRFIEYFDEEFGVLHPTLFNGTYSQALNEAKSSLQFLLVYLHESEHRDTAEFCRTTLCDADVAEFLNTRLIFWACGLDSPEGYRVSRSLRVDSFPFLCLIVLRNNKMTVVARMQGPIAATDLTTRLGRLMDDNMGSIVSERASREERSFNQSLRDEQDQAYLESLRVDQEKARKKREEQDEKDREVQLQLQKELAEQLRIEERVRRKEELRNSIPQEPDSNDPNAIKILLKLPNGARLERHFLKTHSLKHLFNYVFVHESAPDDFQIVTNFPRKVLPCEVTSDNPEPPTFQDVGLGKSELLFVHDNEA